MSQEAMAEVLGVSFQQVQKYERGANRLSATSVFIAARALGVPVSAFFNFAEEADLPSPEEHDTAELSELLRGLSPEKRQIIDQLARALIST